MDVQLVEHGRFEPNAIWINGLNRETLADYPDYFAIGTGTAIELWKQLTIALVKAGQRGTLDAGAKELI
jgi:hypothetical protein